MPRRLQLKVIIVEYFEVLDLAVASIKNRSGFDNIEQLLFKAGSGEHFSKLVFP